MVIIEELSMPERPPIAKFQIESFRVTIFKVTPSEPNVDLFKNVFGVAPINSQIINNPVKTIISEGVINNIKYSIEENVQLINIIFFGIDQVNPLNGAPLPVVSFEASLSVLDTLWRQLSAIEGLKVSTRIAIAPILVLPVEDKAKGYTSISEFLPFKINSETSSDFLFQINKPKRLPLQNGKEYELNTVVQISVAAISTFVIASEGTPIYQPKESFRARIQFDVNNKPEQGLVLTNECADGIYRDCLESIRSTLATGITL